MPAHQSSLAEFKKELALLVAQFGSNLSEYKGTEYNEARLRHDFLNPFFHALGWDISNRAGLIQSKREVEIESATRVGSSKKRADYLFRTDGRDRFVCEAKKPREELHKSHIFQTKRYAWNKDLPFAVLTDFEETKFYIVGSRPDSEEPAVGELKALHFSEYEENAELLWNYLSRESVGSGYIDRLIDDLPKKAAGKGRARQGYLIKPDRTRALDSDFLNFLDDARKELASSLVKHNDRETLLADGTLNAATQKILDRILFLRICEDRDIDTGVRLETLIETWQKENSRLAQEGRPRGESLYRCIARHFRELDRRPPTNAPYFNGQLFKKDDSEDLEVGDEFLIEFIRDLSDENSPYLFNVIPVEILGSVYERFLGKVVRLQGRSATIEEKPEVRKAGGVYYTPRYIVDYIVEQTVGKLLDAAAASSKDLKAFTSRTETLRFLDPACGSGSFLIRAFERTCEHWEKRLTDDLPPKDNKEERAAWEKRHRRLCWVDPETDAVHLTVDLKRRVLTGNIYGVDLDAAAVEVTQLSLYLKMLEGENRTTLNKQRELLPDENDTALLPPLQDNIKCGNSLIASDLLTGVFPTDELIAEMKRLNAFDWNVGFETILKAGGFDAVIGNPPYVRQEALKDTKDYFQRHYESFSGTGDLYTYFMEKGVKLIRTGGRYSIIVSSSVLRATYAEALRETLLKHAALVRVVDFGGAAVFADAKDTYVCIPVLAKEKQPDSVEVSKVQTLKADSVMTEMQKTDFSAPLSQFTREAWILKSDRETALFNKVMSTGVPLGDYVERRFFRGVTSGLNAAFVINGATKAKLIHEHERSAELIHPVRGGEDVREFFIEPTDAFLIFTRRGTKIDEYPAIKAHLEQYRADLTPRGSDGDRRGRKPGTYRWYEIQDDVAYFDVFHKPKLVFPDISKHPRFCYDDTGIYLTNTAYALGTGDKYLLGILNSQLFWFAISNISIPFGVRAGEFRYRLIYQYMQKVPVRKLELTNAADKASHGKMVDLVNRRLALTPKLRAAKSEADKATLQNAVAATDQKIDALVYELYGLTEDEIKLVEEAT